MSGLTSGRRAFPPGVDPVTVGMTLIVAAEIGHFLAIDQEDRKRLACIINCDRKPGHASRFDHDLYVVEGAPAQARASR